MTTTVGILYPGLSAEDDYPLLERRLGSAVSLPVHHTYMIEDAHRIDALLEWGRADNLADGATALADRSLDSIMWACTSGSFAYGWEGAHEQAESLGKAAGVPASSTSLAFVHALQAMGISRVAVAATYPDDVARLFVDFLAAGGISVSAMSSHDIFTAAEVGTLGRDGLLRIATEGDDVGADAVLLPDTALHSVEHLDEVESIVGKCVLTANQVSAWEGLRIAGNRDRYDGPGTLFRVAFPGDAEGTTQGRSS